MRWSRATLLASLFVLAACRDVASPRRPEADLLGGALVGATPERYIVVFQGGVADPAGLAEVLVTQHGGSLLHTYTSALSGFAALLSPAAAAALRATPGVGYVEQDQIATLDGTQSMDTAGDPWGLDRIDQQALPLSATYTFAATGAGVHAYIIDSGISTLNPDFEGRADNVYDVVGLGGQDCNGHGTHVAGSVGGATYGVAKNVLLHGVRVSLYCAGIGWTSDVIAGVDWVTANHVNPAVANMSLIQDPSAALNAAVTGLWNSGVFVAVAAGNYNNDACLYSPASATGAFTVAASTSTDAGADFSDWGTCVEAYAPGTSIKSTWLAGLTATMSGTSMATPHVTGVAALYKATFGDAPSATVADWIINGATNGVITGNPGGTPNRLLYKAGL
jgi:subtilisin family serine protease